MRLNKIRKFIITVIALFMVLLSTLLTLSLQGCMCGSDDSCSPHPEMLFSRIVSYIDSLGCIHFHCQFDGLDKDARRYYFLAEVKIASEGVITVIKKEDKRRLYPVTALCVNSVEYVEYGYYSTDKSQHIFIIESNDGSGWKEWEFVDELYSFPSLFSLKNTDASFETLTLEALGKYLDPGESATMTVGDISYPIANDVLYNNYALVDVSINENGLTDYVAYFAKYIDNAWTFTKIEDFGYMKYNSEEDSFTFEEFTEVYKKIFSAMGYSDCINNYNYHCYNNYNNYNYNDYINNNNNIITDDGTVHNIDFDWVAKAFYYEAYDSTSATPEVPVRRELIEKPEGYNF